MPPKKRFDTDHTQQIARCVHRESLWKFNRLTALPDTTGPGSLHRKDTPWNSRNPVILARLAAKEKTTQAMSSCVHTGMVP
eukprot:1139419-Pelagomonas_calceolata.AAC.12